MRWRNMWIRFLFGLLCSFICIICMIPTVFCRKEGARTLNAARGLLCSYWPSRQSRLIQSKRTGPQAVGANASKVASLPRSASGCQLFCKPQYIVTVWYFKLQYCCEHPIDGNPWPAGARDEDKSTARRLSGAALDDSRILGWKTSRDTRERTRASLEFQRTLDEARMLRHWRFPPGEPNAVESSLEGRVPGTSWDKELEGPYWRTSRRGDPASRPVVPTPCPGFLGGFPLGVKANAEAAVWRSHAANTTTSSDQGTKIRRSIRRGRDARFSGGGSSVASTP